MSNQKQLLNKFTQPLLAWYAHSGRHDLPWQRQINPYRVWVSEIMLQQTQVATVIPYYERFMQSFPDVSSLANASQEEVLSHWAGLGYYARGRNLHKAAQQIVAKHAGEFPNNFDDILALPGIGRSTAGAILSISLQQRYAILDGNVKRVLTRYFAVHGWPGEKQIEKQLWQMADQLTPAKQFADYTQAIMDLGATVCKRTKPLCEQCPVAQSCQAYAQNEVALYPYPKPKKDKPTKHAWMVVQLYEDQQIKLQKRPQSGIWAGLWSLPEFTTHDAAMEYIQSETCALQSLIEWESFKHTFSHYHLQIHPLIAVQSKMPESGVNNSKVEESKTGYQVKSGTQSAADNSAADFEQREWITIDSVLQSKVGVPAPVMKIISKI